MAHGVYVIKRGTKSKKVCPNCKRKAATTAKVCPKCGADLRAVKRSFTGKDWSYHIRWFDLREHKFCSKKAGPDKRFAEMQAAEKRKELMMERHAGIRKISYDDFCTEYLMFIEDMRAEATCVEYERVLRQFKRICNPRDLTVIDLPMLEKFRSHRQKETNSMATVNKSLRILQSILERAKKQRYIHKNPFSGNRKDLIAREPEPTPNLMEAPEFQKLLGACTSDRWSAICCLGYYGGLRRGEILALEWDDVDFDEGMLRICNTKDHVTKSRKIRYVPMSAELAEALKKLLPERFKNKLVFTNYLGRKVRNNVSRDFAAVVIRAGLVDENGKEKYSMHDLRATCATNLLESGADPKTVQEILGHSSINTTMKYYVGVRARSLKSAVDRMSKYISQSG